MKISIYDVAQKAGVSVVTVSRVLNNSETVREKNREKVLKAIEELGYHPNASARNLARGKTNVIGLIIPNLSDPFIMSVVETVDKELEERGYFLALSVIGRNETDVSKKISLLFQQERVDGILALTPMYEEDVVLDLKKKKIPFVIMDNQRFPFTVPSIVVDNYKGGYQAARHLLELGHTKIAHIGGPEDILAASQREEGFAAALKEVSLMPFDIIRNEFEIKTGYDAMKLWIENNSLPTAVFAADDHIAFGAIDAAREAGLRIPEDISVIGFDDHPFTSQLHPLLTTFRQPSFEMGRSGVEILFKIMAGEQKRNIVIKLEPDLIVRESTSAI